jgi:hypothetical protein
LCATAARFGEVQALLSVNEAKVPAGGAIG